jgi:hypothetical protein
MILDNGQDGTYTHGFDGRDVFLMRKIRCGLDEENYSSRREYGHYRNISIKVVFLTLW